MSRLVLCLFFSLSALSGIAQENNAGTDNGYPITITDYRSLIHIGSLDSFDLTEGGTKAASLLVKGITEKTRGYLEEARVVYKEITPKENFGGEYTALAWFNDYLLADESTRAEMISDPFVKAYYDFFGANDYEVLVEYINRKYAFAREAEDKDPDFEFRRRAFLEDFILFNNPRRPEWENTPKILGLLKEVIKEDSHVADIGSGPGFYSYEISKMLGAGGMVYALDTKNEHLEYLLEFINKQGITTIKPVHSQEDDVTLEENSINVAYMCSLYHIIYGVATEESREAFINSIKRAMKDGALLIIVDNGPVSDSDLPYHGCYIAKELTIAQLQYYGFKLRKYEQIIPQRYYLEFVLDK